MLYAVEALIVFYLGYRSWRIFSQGAARNILGLGIFLAGVAASSLCLLACDWVVERAVANLALRLAIPLCAAISGYICCCLWLRRKMRAAAGPAGRLAGRLSLARGADRAICAGLALAFLACGFAALIFLTAMAAQEPGWRQRLAEKTICLRALLPAAEEMALSDPTAAAPTSGIGMESGPSADLRSTMTMQDRFFRGLRDGWDKTRRVIAEETGTKAAVENIKALKLIINLSPAEHAWLVGENPRLRTLVDHPALAEILDSEEILRLVAAVGQGSPTAIYALGDQPAIQAFFNDESIMKIVGEIDLLALQRQVQERRRSLGRRVPVAWAVAEIENTLSLDLVLADPAAWRQVSQNAGTLSWPRGTRIGLARTGFVFHEGGEIPSLHVEAITTGTLTVLVNGRSLPIEAQEETNTFVLPFGRGTTEVVLMLQFQAQGQDPSCLVQAFLPDQMPRLTPPRAGNRAE